MDGLLWVCVSRQEDSKTCQSTEQARREEMRKYKSSKCDIYYTFVDGATATTLGISARKEAREEQVTQEVRNKRWMDGNAILV